MATDNKISRKELLKKEDAFIAAANQGAKWLAGNRLPVILGTSVVVAVILATWGVVEYLHRRDESASILFQRGLQMMSGEILPDGSDTPADPNGDEPTFATEAEKFKAAREQFDKVRAEAGSSAVASLAGFFVADLTEKLGEKEKAEEEFNALVERLSSSDSLYFLAVERAAYLREARGDAEGALKLMAKLANVDKGFYGDFATFHQARLYLDKGDNDRAKNLLARIENDFPNSPVLEDARHRLAAMATPEAPKAEGGNEAAGEPAAAGTNP